PLGKGVCLKKGSEIAVLSIGHIGQNVKEAIETIPGASKCAHYAMRFVKPLDEDLLQKVFKKYSKVITVEEGVAAGGFGSAVLEFAARNSLQVPVITLGIPDEFISQGSVEELQEIAEISVNKIR